MTKTMTANIPGARLREAERQLATLRGEEAVNAYIAANPNEIKVLEQMVEWRRAGRPVPSLTRIQRVMLWSDGEIELKVDASAEAPPRRGAGGGGARPGGFGPAGGQRAGHAAGPRPRSDARTGGGAPPRGGGRPGNQAAPGAGQGRSGGGSWAGAGGGRSGGGRPPGRGRPGGRGPRDADERVGVRAGEGWALVREGDEPEGVTLEDIAVTRFSDDSAEGAPETGATDEQPE